MLLRFRFSNFRSFKLEQELSFVASAIQDTIGVLSSPAVSEGVLPVAAIYGANASGKTNVLRALDFMKEAVLLSYRQWQPDADISLQPFLGDEHLLRGPSEFSVDILIDGVRYQYGFGLAADSVTREWLVAFPKGKRQQWFQREGGKAMRFSPKLAGDNRTIANLTRRNSLFLSCAAQNNHTALQRIYGWFSNLGLAFSPFRILAPPTADLLRRPEMHETIQRLLAAADVGVTGAECVDLNLSDEMKDAVRALATMIVKETRSDANPEVSGSVSQIKLIHLLGGRSLLLHPEQESDGTKAYLQMVGPVVAVLGRGSLLCIDELDQSLHPLLAAQIINLFKNRDTNPRGAQLLFTTHDTNLLRAGALRRDEIWFAEKDREGASRLYPLTDYKPRKGENIENGYLQGRYGAIPFLNPDDFVAITRASNG